MAHIAESCIRAAMAEMLKSDGAAQGAHHLAESAQKVSAKGERDGREGDEGQLLAMPSRLRTGI